MFCINCGCELPSNAKFCLQCGSKIGDPTSEVNNVNEDNKRKQVFEGEIKKCPNCGETINSFQTNCPNCGYEFRGQKANSFSESFAAGMNKIESELFFFAANKLSKKIEYIRNFPIPNSKEELYEFMVISSNNIDVKLYKKGILEKVFGHNYEDELKLSDAWLGKMKMIYQKAKMSIKDAKSFEYIENIYKDIMEKIGKK